MTVFVYLEAVDTKNTGGVQTAVPTGVCRFPNLEHLPALSLGSVQGGQLLKHLLGLSVT